LVDQQLVGSRSKALPEPTRISFQSGIRCSPT
jgi:hypothetical protein